MSSQASDQRGVVLFGFFFSFFSSDKLESVQKNACEVQSTKTEAFFFFTRCYLGSNLIESDTEDTAIESDTEDTAFQTLVSVSCR